MKKESIAKLRRIVQDPVRFIDESLDKSTLFFIKYLQSGFWFSLAIVLGSITSMFTSHTSDQNLGPALAYRHSRTSRSNSPAHLLNSESSLKNRSLHSSSAVLVKGRHSNSQAAHSLKEDSSIFASFAARARRFPMSAVISVRPTDLDRKVSMSFSLKLFDKACYKSVFSDAFLDASGQPIVSYGIYLDTYSATRPLWTRLCSQQNMVALYQGLSGLGNTLKNYFSDQSSGLDQADIEDTTAEVLSLMRDDLAAVSTSRRLHRTHSNFPLPQRSISFHRSPSLPQMLEANRRDSAVLASSDNLEYSESMQRKVGLFVSNVQKSFVFKIDVFRILTVKIEQ